MNKAEETSQDIWDNGNDVIVANGSREFHIVKCTSPYNPLMRRCGP